MYNIDTPGVGAPIMYDHMNIYNSQTSPSTLHCKNTSLQWYFARYLLQKAISLCKWKTPVNWDKDYFLYTLFCWGIVAVVKTDKFGVIPQGCGVKGYNVFYRPTHAVITNPLLKGIKEPLIGRECVIFKCTNDYRGIMDLINRYADEMAIAMESLDMNNMNSKLAFMFSARNKSGAETLKKLMDRVMSGELACYYDEKLRRATAEGSTEPWSVFINNLKANYIAPDIMDTLNRLEEMFEKDLGFPTVRSDKKERLIQAEANSNNVSASARAEMWLDSWQESCRQVKNMFNIDVSVDWRFNPRELDSNVGGVAK